MRSISPIIIADQAKKMWFKIKVLDNYNDIFKVYFWDRTSCLFKNIDCGLNLWIWARFAIEKKLTYIMLGLKKIRVPKSVVLEINDEDNINLDWYDINYPVVVKPNGWEHGDGVSVNLKNKAEVIVWIKNALKYDKEVIIQEFFKWEDFRIIVVNHKFVAAMKRVPAHVIADGIHTIKDLINIENNNPDRAEWHLQALSKILVDNDSIDYIKQQWYDLQDIPEKWKIVYIRKNANLSTGWISVDVTDLIHPEIIKMCEKASKAINLKVCWIDYISEDITKPLKEQKWWIIEINSIPGLRWHHFPAVWKPRNVAKKILELAYKTYHW